MRSLTKQRKAKPSKTKSQIKDKIVLGCQEHKVFLTGFNPNPYTKERLHQLLRDKIPGYMNVILPKSVYKGFAFIDLKSQEHVKQVLEMGHVVLGGHKMILKEFKQGRELKRERMYMNEKKVFIHQIPRSWSLDELRKIFSQFGPLEEIYMCFKKSEDPNDIESVTSKIGFAIYKNKKTAEMIYNKGTVLYKNIVLKVKRVEDKAGLFDEAQIQEQARLRGKLSRGQPSLQAQQPRKKSSASRCFSQASHLFGSTTRETVKGTAASTALIQDSASPQNPLHEGLESIQNDESEQQEANDKPILASKEVDSEHQKFVKNFDCSAIIKQGFEEMFKKLGIADFEFDEFMKFTAFQYLQSKKVMMMKKQSELLMGSSSPLEQPLAPVLQNEHVGQGKKANVEITKGVSKIESFRRRVEFHGSKPTTENYHSLFGEFGTKLDHKFRNLRLNQSTRKQPRKKNRKRGRVGNQE